MAQQKYVWLSFQGFYVEITVTHSNTVKFNVGLGRVGKYHDIFENIKISKI